MSKFGVFATLLIIVFAGALGGAIYYSGAEGRNLTKASLEENNKAAEAVVKNLSDQQKELVAKKGDTATINYVGTVGGVQFDGGTDQDYDLLLGSGTFIDGFEDQIVDHKIGENFDVNVVFPEDYNSDKLKGQDAVFNVTLKNITKA